MNTHIRLVHQVADHIRIEPRIQMTPKDSSGHIESTTDLALRLAMYVLREVVRQSPAIVVILRKRFFGNHVEVNEKGRREGGDKSGRGAQSGLVHVREMNAGGDEGWDLGERIKGTG